MKINNDVHMPNSKINAVQIKNNNPSFGSLKTLGDKIVKSNTLQKVGKAFEFDGYNMPFASLATVCFGGVLLPRMITARDENEYKEVFVRDFTTIVVLLFCRKAIQNVVSKACSKLSGLALLKYPDKHQGFLKQAYNYLRPEKGVSALSSSDLKSKYTNIDKFNNGIVDFCQFVKKSGGDVAKLFKSDKNIAKAAGDAYKAANVGGDFATASSDKIIDAFTKLQNQKSSALNGVYDYFKNDKNGIVKKARVMNSSFDFVATFLLVPGFLGYALPQLMEKDIKNKYKNNPYKDEQKVVPKVEPKTEQKTAEPVKKDNLAAAQIYAMASKSVKSTPAFKEFV